MQPTYLQSIIARTLALVDAVLGAWTGPVNATTTGPCNITVLTVDLNRCGLDLASQIGQLVQQSVVLLNSIMAALNVTSS